MAKPRRLPDLDWLRGHLDRTGARPPRSWESDVLLQWMEQVPNEDWRRISRAWSAYRRYHQAQEKMEPARDEFTAMLDGAMADLPEQWQKLLRLCPAAVRARLHVVALESPDADPWGVVSRLVAIGFERGGQ